VPHRNQRAETLIGGLGEGVRWTDSATAGRCVHQPDRDMLISAGVQPAHGHDLLRCWLPSYLTVSATFCNQLFVRQRSAELVLILRMERPCAGDQSPWCLHPCQNRDEVVRGGDRVQGHGISSVSQVQPDRGSWRACEDPGVDHLRSAKMRLKSTDNAIMVKCPPAANSY
jgi:hypothetical protein